MVLGKMKETAEAYLGKKVTHVIVAVPACSFFIPIVGRIPLLIPLQTSMTPNARQEKTRELSPRADPPYHQ